MKWHHLAAIAVIVAVVSPSGTAMAGEVAWGGGSGSASGGHGGGQAAAEAWRAITMNNGVVARHRGNGRSQYRYVIEGKEGMQGLGCADAYAERLMRIAPDGSRRIVRTTCPRPGTRRISAAPPTSEDVLRLTPITAPGVGINPRVRGLVGMRTWLWYDGPQTADVQADVYGWSVTTSLHPVEYRWMTGDGARYTSTRPGTEAAPAATHVYVDDRAYTVILEVTWAGSYTVAGPDGVADTIDLGPVVVSSERPYEVIELQAVRRS